MRVGRDSIFFKNAIRSKRQRVSVALDGFQVKPDRFFSTSKGLILRLTINMQPLEGGTVCMEGAVFFRFESDPYAKHWHGKSPITSS